MASIINALTRVYVSLYSRVQYIRYSTVYSEVFDTENLPGYYSKAQKTVPAQQVQKIENKETQKIENKETTS